MVVTKDHVNVYNLVKSDFQESLHIRGGWLSDTVSR